MRLSRKFPSEGKSEEFHVPTSSSLWRWESAPIVSKALASHAGNFHGGAFLNAERRGTISFWAKKAPASV
jgi:hypothetical protein